MPLVVTQQSIDGLNERQKRALRNGREGVNRTRADNNQLSTDKQYIEYWLNEAWLAPLVESLPLPDADRKKLDEFVKNATDAQLAELKALVEKK